MLDEASDKAGLSNRTQLLVTYPDNKRTEQTKTQAYSRKKN